MLGHTFSTKMNIFERQKLNFMLIFDFGGIFFQYFYRTVKTIK